MEKGGGTSKTVPDETLTIKEILNKYVMGQNHINALSRESGYNSEPDTFESPDLDALKRLDEVDRREYSKNVKLDIKAFEESVQKQKDEMSAAEKIAAEKAAKATQTGEAKQPKPVERKRKEGGSEADD